MLDAFPNKTKALLQIAEMYRIYSAIDHSLLQSTSASLVVTSAQRGEGKTSMIVGLATMAALKDKKHVLALDLNWLDPSLHTYFGLDLIDPEKFRNGHSLSDLVCKSGVENLDVLPSMDPAANGFDVQGNLIAQDLIRQARDLYDLLFIDTSRIFPTNRNMIDPVTLSKIADATTLVVLANVTPRQQVKRAQSVLESAGAKIIGVVVNQWQNLPASK